MPERPLRLPILMYHKVGQPVVARQDAFLNVAARDFRRQMRVLARLGYRAIPFAEAVAGLARQRPLPPRAFAITFDDGYACVGEHAAPILAEFGFPATVFVVSSQAGGSNAWDGPEGHPVLPLMGWQELRALQARGWEMAGHTRAHPHLNTLSDAEAAEEIREGKAEAEAALGCALQTFCYPFGHYDARTPALVRAAGFTGACTTRSGMARSDHDPFLLPRIKVAYRDGVFGLLYRLLLRPHLPDLRPRRR
ncbi:MAG TPA: polysaccharide deacetylase family protein [Chthonomonadaceae bacterium]|nr:polysaccharide deacetylase family protein [Chthonomonadaceae bacterium]